jgi:CHAD domain-containing protein
MAFRIKADEPIAKALPRLAKGQLVRSVEALTGLPMESTDEVIHDVRKRLKRVKAVLQLARPFLPEKLYRKTRSNVQAASQPLGPLRNAVVLLETILSLVERFGLGDHPEALDSIREVLQAEIDETRDQVLKHGRALANAIQSLEKAIASCRDWDLRVDDRKLIPKAWVQVYRRARRVNRRCLGEPTVEDWHDLRKRVKDCLHAFELLLPLKTGYFQDRVASTAQLSQDLGDLHDLDMLELKLETLSERLPPGVASPFLSMLEQRRGEVIREIRETGQDFFADNPRACAEIIASAWKNGRTESRSFAVDQSEPG